MKTFIALFALAVVICLASAGGPLNKMIHKEVKLLYQRNSNMTQTDCTNQCDDMFQVLDPHHEKVTDEACEDRCRCHVTLKDACKPPHHHGIQKRRGHHHTHHSRSSRRVIRRHVHPRGTSKPVVG